MFEGIWRDLVYAGRSLAKARAFTLVCVVSLGIGMVPVIEEARRMPLWSLRNAAVPLLRRHARQGRWLKLSGARENNLQNVEAAIPLGTSVICTARRAGTRTG